MSWSTRISLRQTFASWLVEINTDTYHVQKLLGHSDLKLTARYAHVGENALRAAVQGPHPIPHPTWC